MKSYLRLFLLLLSGFACLGLTLHPAKSVFGQAAKTDHGKDAPEAVATPQQLPKPLLFEDDFENGLDKWEIVDNKSWALQEHGKGKSLSITRRDSEYKPKVRSPRHIALMKNIEAASFELTFKVRSTKDTGNHRDCCVFFGYENSSRFYYVHLGAKPDPHSGQIMIVKDAPRLALTDNKKRTPWTDAWHDVKLVRDSQQGTIEIYFDDMTKPHMTVRDKTFGNGRIGIGSFDDMDAFDEVKLRGQRSDSVPVAFADRGKFKMLYDARQRPASVFLQDRLFIVYNGDAKPSKSGKGSAYPMLISYESANRTFSSPVRLGKKSSTDHHDSPIIWADKEDYLHVLYGCHKTPGTHLISTQPVKKDTSDIAWQEAPQIAPKLSYPTVFRISGDRELIYYRTDGHTSSWTYRISDDNGKTWHGPGNDVTDLDSKGRLDWSSYQTKLPSKDGKFLHVVYTDYDDNKTSPDPQRFFNPRYNALASNEWKYNLSYVKINLENDEVRNTDRQIVRTPIDIDYSKTHCQIWDTDWRGAGVPPAVALDENGDPVFLHVLSEGSLTEHQYYYVRRVAKEWKQTPITPSNHQWNSCYLSRDSDGTLHAYVVVADGYLEGGYMDRHGGGRIEEWVSDDKGNHWTKRREVSPTSQQYAGWRFNNVQPVVRPDGNTVAGMLLYYGWKDENAPKASAFLLHEGNVHDSAE